MKALTRYRRAARAGVCLLASAFMFCIADYTVSAQAAATATQAPGAPSRPSGTVKSISANALTLTNKDGQDVSVALTATTKVLIVPPGSTSLSAATAGAAGDIQTGDRVLVTGSPGDPAAGLTAVRVVVMKSAAIAQAQSEQSSAWAQGTGGIVKSVSGDAVVISSGMKTVTVTVTPKTILRRYAPGSIKYEDAQTSTLSAIHPEDQLRVRGEKSADGLSITADEIVTGAFANYSGTIANVDSAAGSITLKDLASKKTVTVAVLPSSDVRRLPMQMAQMIAMRMKGAESHAAGGAQATGAPAKPAGAAAQPGAGQHSEEANGETTQHRAGAAGSDLSRMLSRLPTETLGGLKTGEAVMIVASPSASDPSKSAAITLLVGVEPILEAPAGSSTTLSPWNVSGGEGATSMGGATP